MRSTLLQTPVFFVLLVCFVLAAAPSHARLDIDFGATVQAANDADLYVAISSRYFERDRQVIHQMAVVATDPDDLAVALYLSRYSGRSADDIIDLHDQETSWLDVSGQLGLPADIWFVEASRDPEPPFRTVYAYWNHYRRDPRQAIPISDDDARNLVAVRVIHEYFRVPVETAMEWRATGRSLSTILAGEYRQRHGMEPRAAATSAD